MYNCEWFVNCCVNDIWIFAFLWNRSKAKSLEEFNICLQGPSIMELKKPLIAAVEGYAVAGGLELSLMGILLHIYSILTLIS